MCSHLSDLKYGRIRVLERAIMNMTNVREKTLPKDWIVWPRFHYRADGSIIGIEFVVDDQEGYYEGNLNEGVYMGNDSDPQHLIKTAYDCLFGE